MRTPAISPALLALGWTLAAPAFAQDRLKHDLSAMSVRGFTDSI
ncbi:MAG: hypothetical protein JWL77_5467 [Chthonomonadaceae bacterium]|jgi:hypothetical protein|nr:hypothetical protein [Chthonomonadaceae bacterium]